MMTTWYVLSRPGYGWSEELDKWVRVDGDCGHKLVTTSLDTAEFEMIFIWDRGGVMSSYSVPDKANQ